MEGLSLDEALIAAVRRLCDAEAEALMKGERE
jgi:hypothetical protein